LLQYVVIPALVALLVLIYTWWPRGAASSTLRSGWASGSALASAVPPPHGRATDRTLRVLAVVGLLLALSLIPLVAAIVDLITTQGVAGEASNQLLLGLWGPLLGQTSYLLAFGVGVAALTAARATGHRTWARVLLVAVLAVAYSPTVATPLLLFAPDFAPQL